MIAEVAEISTQIRGISYNQGDAIQTYREGYIPILRANNITEEGLRFEDLIYVPRHIVKEHQLLRRGDILVAASSGSKDIVGKAALVKTDISCSFGAFCKVIRPNKNMDFDYFSYFFQTSDYRKKISALSAGANINNLRNEHLNGLRVPLPPLETQKKIAAILNKADELRQNDKKILEKYDQLAQSIFLEMFGDPEMNSKHWQIKPFSFFARIDTRMTTNFKDFSEFPHVGIANIEQDSGRIQNTKLVKEESLISGKYIFSKEHIIYSKIRPNLNKVALPDFDGLCSADAYPILVDRCNTNRIFFAYILRSKLFLEHILKHSQRTNIPKANKLQVESFHCIAPPKDIQDLFAQIVVKIEEQKGLSQQSLQKSEELFQSLLQRAFSGKLI